MWSQKNKKYRKKNNMDEQTEICMWLYRAPRQALITDTDQFLIIIEKNIQYEVWILLLFVCSFTGSALLLPRNLLMRAYDYIASR